ncbi:DUF885 domain-containing protein [Kineosporia sp. J2-2]|uniref:DUF885 domain-containing protein n=1 Tax=Kineosporia corallincola TaxID=2835133 RepID=A0ABS5THK9_9ACTN|nr:DUF885 domain-containing protein [Kineosporia corallincola]MBT0770530.1 DUF885 domain-containing protein [Kineosporia corallincola]
MREQQGEDPIVTARFRDAATKVLDALLAAAPEEATGLGEHRYDDRTTELTVEATIGRASMLVDALSALDDVDDTALTPDDRVDLEILRTRVSGTLWEQTELRRFEVDPLMHLPADGLYPLITRTAPDLPERLRALTSRLEQVPERLEQARSVLNTMPRLAVQTAITQARGTVPLLTGDLEPLLAQDASLAGPVREARDAALAALEDHARWLESRLPVSDGDPRLGELNYAARLWYTLDTETGPDALLTRAESDLQAIEEEIAELACRISGRPMSETLVREVLDETAAAAPVTATTVRPLCEEALELLAARVRELGLVTVPDQAVRVIEMPPSRAGIAVAYCDAPGPLEPGEHPTFFAVAPAPADWDEPRTASFHREYNGHMLRNLAVHEAFPGHAVQLAHAARYRGATPVRTAVRSGTFIEGWAVYAEELMAGAGLGLRPDDDDRLRLMRLKMSLRSTINAILDVRVHARGMTEDEAVRLMTARGHQEEGEAAGKWRRALLTSTQLSTYYVGHREIRDLAGRLHAQNPDLPPLQVHDQLLSHGAPPPRHLRALLELE